MSGFWGGPKLKANVCRLNPSATGVQHVPEGSGAQGNIEKSGCKIICGTPTTLTVKGLMMMMMMMMNTPSLLDMRIFCNRFALDSLMRCECSGTDELAECCAYGGGKR